MTRHESSAPAAANGAASAASSPGTKLSVVADSGWSAIRLAPQRTQKLAPSELRMPHSGQNTLLLLVLVGAGVSLGTGLSDARAPAGEDLGETLDVVGRDD